MSRGWTDNPLFWPLALILGLITLAVPGHLVASWLGMPGDMVANLVTIGWMLILLCMVVWKQQKPMMRLRRRLARWVVDGIDTRPGADAWYMTGPSRGQWKNLCCKGFKPLSIAWQEVFNQWPHDSVIKIMSQKDIDQHSDMIRLTLFEGYARPVVSWCEENLQNPYYAWCDRHEFHLMIPDEGDRMLWQLTWGDKLPEARDIQQAVEKYEEFQGKNLVDGP